jgi:hypothetical protein
LLVILIVVAVVVCGVGTLALECVPEARQELELFLLTFEHRRRRQK